MKRLLLVGAGQAHLNFIQQLKHTPIDNLEITLLTPQPFFCYSEMFPGFLENIYEIEELKIDIKKLIENTQIKWVIDSPLSLDPKSKRLLTGKGDIISFDILSFNLASHDNTTQMLNLPSHIVTMEMVFSNLQLIDMIRNTERLTIVGDNLLSYETALSLQTLRNKHNKRPLTLVNPNINIVDMPPAAADQLLNILRRYPINYMTDTISNYTQYYISSENKQRSIILYLMDKKAPLMFSQAHLPTNEQGKLLIEPTLQVKTYPFIFGSGNYAYLPHQSITLPSHIQNQQQAFTLWNNINGYLRQSDGYLFNPKFSYPFIISIGEKKAYFLYKKLSIKSGIAWKLQDRLNRNVIEKYK